MPNHCSNKLIVTGDAPDLAAFAEGMTYKENEGPGEDSILSLETLLPIPNNLRGNNSLNGGWYDWCVNNWGTKWGCYDIELEKDDDTFTYHFRTAYSPFNYEIFKIMVEKYPRLEFRLLFAEQCIGFLGSYDEEHEWCISDNIIAHKESEDEEEEYDEEESEDDEDECYTKLLPELKEWEGLWNSSG